MLSPLNNEIKVGLCLPPDKFSIIHFKDVNHGGSAPAHYYICIPTGKDGFLLLCIITSQVQKRKDAYDNLAALESLVSLPPRSMSFISIDSVIDCNQSELLTSAALLSRIDGKLEIVLRDEHIPADIKQRVKDAILSSPVVKPFIQQLVKH